MAAVNGDQTLDEAKAWLRERVHDGADCPCCGQRAQVYRRKISAAMVHTMWRMYRAGHFAERGWVNLPEIPQPSRDVATCGYHMLIEMYPDRRIDGGKGKLWRITELGEAFLRGEAMIPKYALVYDGKRLRTEGESITVHDVAPEFNFHDLMAGV